MQKCWIINRKRITYDTRAWVDDLVVGRLVGGLGLDVAGVNLGGRVLGRHRGRQDVAGRLVAVLVGDKGDLDLLAIAVGVAPGALLAVEVLRLAVGVLAVAGHGHASLRPGQKLRFRQIFILLCVTSVYIALQHVVLHLLQKSLTIFSLLLGVDVITT